jgi:hypothetical protein
VQWFHAANRTHDALFDWLCEHANVTVGIVETDPDVQEAPQVRRRIEGLGFRYSPWELLPLPLLQDAEEEEASSFAVPASPLLPQKRRRRRSQSDSESESARPAPKRARTHEMPPPPGPLPSPPLLQQLCDVCRTEAPQVGYTTCAKCRLTIRQVDMTPPGFLRNRSKVLRPACVVCGVKPARSNDTTCNACSYRTNTTACESCDVTGVKIQRGLCPSCYRKANPKKNDTRK